MGDTFSYPDMGWTEKQYCVLLREWELLGPRHAHILTICPVWSMLDCESSGFDYESGTGVCVNARVLEGVQDVWACTQSSHCPVHRAVTVLLSVTLLLRLPKSMQAEHPWLLSAGCLLTSLQ